MKEESRQRLAAIARLCAETAIRGKALTVPAESDPELTARGGAFVTLTAHGRLRGCLGVFASDRPLYETVAAMAADAATADPRFTFDRLTPEDLPDLEIEVSVLSPLRRIRSVEEIELGRHGIYLRRGRRSGCYLPEVAAETGWTREEFLSSCADEKAGLPADSWKDPATEIWIFTTEAIHS